ncbi:sirohydrochlorin ferrochelatase, partial [Trifolium medium]|nr:sirohydrochlorin ferrochelatase [Trifolium medium]
DVVDDRINCCLKHVAGDADECLVCAGTGKCILHQ